jgi:hypothetical protein
MYGGDVRPELFLILSKTPSHAISNCSGESMRLMFGAAGWKIVAVPLKQARKVCQSRLLKAVKNVDRASSIEVVFGFANGFSCATADPTIAAAKTKKPTKHFFLCICNTPVLRTKDSTMIVRSGLPIYMLF